MSDTSVHVQVREIASALGLPFELRANNTLVKYTISDETVTVLVTFVVTNETNREVRYMRRGNRLMQWKLTTDGTGVGSKLVFPDGKPVIARWKYTEVVLWDDAFEPYIENKIGRSETPAEYHARRRWEGEQYRVGSSRSPMDSASRVTEGYSPMEDYWNK
jgi:hypothetical protein